MMRRRALTLATLSLLAIGCQSIAGISDLTANEPDAIGGSGGASAGFGGSMMGGGGKPNGGGGGGKGKPAGVSCDGDDECSTSHCTNGVCCGKADCGVCSSCALSGDGTCLPTVDATCGSLDKTECSNPDTCDAEGVCQPNHVTEGIACGNQDPTECSLPDTCNGKGECAPNNKPSTTPCGGTCVNDTLTAPGTCSAGVCSSTSAPCPNRFGCDAAGKACNNTCGMNIQGGGCAADAVCFAGMSMTNGQCQACGYSPPAQGGPGCGGTQGCDTCTGGVCQKVCDQPGECTASMIELSVLTGGARIECKDQCNGVEIRCVGAGNCEIVCEGSGCNNLVVSCSPDGPCRLHCKGTGCANAKMNCGRNKCEAICEGPTAIMQESCNGSCACTKSGCQ